MVTLKQPGSATADGRRQQQQQQRLKDAVERRIDEGASVPPPPRISVFAASAGKVGVVSGLNLAMATLIAVSWQAAF